MYSTDLEEIHWQVIKNILNLQERKRKYDLREIRNAIFYIVKTDGQFFHIQFIYKRNSINKSRGSGAYIIL